MKYFKTFALSKSRVQLWKVSLTNFFRVQLNSEIQVIPTNSLNLIQTNWNFFKAQCASENSLFFCSFVTLYGRQKHNNKLLPLSGVKSALNGRFFFIQ